MERFRIAINAFIASLVPASLKADREEYRRARLIVGFTLTVMLIFPGYIVTHAFLGDMQGAWVMAAEVMLFPLVITLLQKQCSLVISGNYGILLFYCMSTYFTYTQGGLDSPSLIPKLASPVAALMFAGRASMLFWVSVEFVTITIFFLLTLNGYPFPHHIPAEWLEFDRWTQLVGSIAAVATLFSLSEAERGRTLQSLTAEQETSERLLLNILPAPIAERLKRDTATIAESFSNVTVLFTDIVGFTKLSTRMQPEAVVTILNQIFTEFDALIERYGLEKIKTIGDAYLVVGGLPEPSDNHTECMADMALALVDTLNTVMLPIENARLELRIGMHVGAVVAGVIGTKKFSYDLWGDTVNTASRMESHGEPGRVHCSEEVYQRLRDRFAFEVRDPIDVKGKGLMNTYFLVSRLHTTVHQTTPVVSLPSA